MKKLFAAALLACFAIGAHAQFTISQANVNGGAFNAVTDSATGFEWLSLDATRGMTFADVSSGLGAGGAFEGYRFATMEDFRQLMGDAGSTNINGPMAPVTITIYGLVAALGGQPLNGNFQLYGFIEPTLTVLDGHVTGHNNTLSIGIYDGQYAWSFDGITGLNVEATPDWLVRVPAVPEPSTYALLMGGLGAVVAVARRRRRASDCRQV